MEGVLPLLRLQTAPPVEEVDQPQRPVSNEQSAVAEPEELADPPPAVRLPTPDTVTLVHIPDGSTEMGLTCSLQKPDAVELPLMVPLYPALHVQSLAASDPDMLLLRMGQAVHDTDWLLLLPALNVFDGQLGHAYTY